MGPCGSYRGTSLPRRDTPLGPSQGPSAFCRVPRGRRFLMSKVSLYKRILCERELPCPEASPWGCSCQPADVGSSYKSILWGREGVVTMSGRVSLGPFLPSGSWGSMILRRIPSTPCFIITWRVALSMKSCSSHNHTSEYHAKNKPHVQLHAH